LYQLQTDLLSEFVVSLDLIEGILRIVLIAYESLVIEWLQLRPHQSLQLMIKGERELLPKLPGQIPFGLSELPIADEIPPIPFELIVPDELPPEQPPHPLARAQTSASYD
jgi:hypothetical protein